MVPRLTGSPDSERVALSKMRQRIQVKVHAYMHCDSLDFEMSAAYIMVCVAEPAAT